RAPGRLHRRQHGVRRAVEDGVDPREAVAGQAVADRADDGHRAADGGLKAELTALSRREREQPPSVARDDLLVRRDDRFPGPQGVAPPVGGRIEPADRFDDDVDVAGEQLVDRCGPPDLRELRMRGAFRVGAAIEDVRELQSAGGVGGRQTAGERGADGAETEEADAAAGRTGAGGLKRFDAHSRFISLRRSASRIWHLSRDRAVAGLPWRRRACPSATLDKEPYSVVPRTIPEGPRQCNRYIYIP